MEVEYDNSFTDCNDSSIFIVVCIIYNMVRKRKLDLKLSLPWFIVLIGLIILVWIPDAIAKYQI